MEEFDEIRGLISRVVDSNGKAARSVYDRYKAIVRWRFAACDQPVCFCSLTESASAAADKVPRATTAA